MTRAAGDAVGAYAIEQGTVALNDNDVLSYVGADLTITPAGTTTTVNTPVPSAAQNSDMVTLSASVAASCGGTLPGTVKLEATKTVERPLTGGNLVIQ